MPPSTTRTREQVNFGIPSGDPLVERLRAAEATTGKRRPQIARQVVDQFLDVWLAAQLRQRSIADEARAAALSRVVAQAEPSTVVAVESMSQAVDEFQKYLRVAGRLLEASPGSSDFVLALAELSPPAPEAGGSAVDVQLRLERLATGV